MAINLWEQAGSPTEYNPLPAGWVNRILNLPRLTDYIITFKAKSPTNKVLQVLPGGTPILVNLTPEFKDYSYTFNFTATNFHIYYDVANDIEIKNIVVSEKPTGKTTINGVDGFGTVKPGFNGKLSAKGDFTGKVQGDLSNNPHIAWRTGTNPPVTSLLTPNSPKLTGGGWYNEFVQDKLDGSYAVSSSNVNGGISQHMFTFDIIALIEKEITIKAIPYADKMQWLKDNINKISVDWYGVGSGPAGNKANLRLWFYGGDAWGATTASHTSGSVTNLNRTISSNIGDTIGPGGFVHAIAYTDASNGSIVSSISTDYISITVEMKQSAIVDSKWVFPPTVKVIDNNTIEQTALSSGADERPYINVNVEPNTQYTLSHQEPNDAVYASYIKEGTSASGTTIGTMATDAKALTFTTTSNPVITITKVLGGAAVGVKKTFSKPMLNLGPNSLPYEPKRGERMVMPVVAGKNLFDGMWLPGYYIESSNGQPTVSTTNTATLNFVPVTAGKTYTLSNNKNEIVRRIATYDANKTLINGNFVVNAPAPSHTFTIPAGVAFIKFHYLINVPDLTAQLEEGAAATPFEKFRVQRARKINGVPKKNLLDPKAWVRGRIYDGTFVPTGFRVEGNNVVIVNTNAAFVSQIVAVEPNTNYSAWHKSNANHGIYAYTKAGGALNPVVRTSPVTFNSGNNTEIIFALYKAGAMDGTPEATFIEPQLEKADKETAFEPFKLVPKRAVKERIVGKNLFPGFVPGYITVGVLNENPTSPDVGQVTSKWMPCEPNTPYVVSGGDRNTWHFKNAAGVINTSASIPNPTTPADAAFMRVYYSTNGTHKNIQVEKGLSATAYEPPKLMGRPARRGLEFNGATDYISVNHASLDTIDVTVKFIAGETKPGAYKMIWGASNTLNYIGIRTSDFTAFCSLHLGGVQVSIPLSSAKLTTDKVHEVRMTYDKSYVRIYLDGALLYQAAETRALTTYSTSLIGRYTGGATFSHDNAILSAKSPGNFDFDFTKPRNNLGTKFKGNNGIDGTITGNPIQLNRQARR